MNRRPYLWTLIGLLLVTSLGCNSNSCGQRMTFREWFSNRPRPIRDLFSRGDECDECSTHAGQLEMGSYDCPTGNCQTGIAGFNGGEVDYYPSDAMPAGAGQAIENRTRTGFAPSFTPSELGSGVRSNAELELPPMYGR